MSNEIDLGEFETPLTEAEEAADKIADSIRDMLETYWVKIRSDNDGKSKYTINVSITCRPEGEGTKWETHIKNTPPATEDERDGFVSRR